MAAREDDTKYCVGPFNGNNFSLFKRRVEAVFAAKELEDYLENEPDEGEAAEVRKAKKAYALLLTFLDDSILATLATESSACEMWTSLKKKYEKVSAVSQILVRKKLVSLKKSRDSSMQEHINEVLATVNELRISGAEVKDMDVVIYLLMSLPADYDVITSTIENQPNETLTLDFVVQRLLNAEDLKWERNPDDENIVFKADERDAGSESSFWEECVGAKQCNTQFSKGPGSREEKPMRLVDADICGPINSPAEEGYRNVMSEQKKDDWIQDVDSRDHGYRDEEAVLNVDDLDAGECKNENEGVGSEGERELPDRLNDRIVYEVGLTSPDSLSFDDMKTLPKEEREHWRKAMNEELESIDKDKVRKRVEFPKDHGEVLTVPDVDYLLIAGSYDSEVKVVIQLLCSEFEMSKAETANADDNNSNGAKAEAEAPVADDGEGENEEVEVAETPPKPKREKLKKRRYRGDSERKKRKKKKEKNLKPRLCYLREKFKLMYD